VATFKEWPAVNESIPNSQTADAPSAEVVLVGAGVQFPEQLTTEALEALRRSRAIFTIIPEATVSRLPVDLCDKCVSLLRLYDPFRKRRDNYKDAIETIARRVMKNESIAYLAPGHPLVFDSVSEGLRLRALADGFAIRIVPGVSCIDTILADVGYEPANGLIVHEATAAVFERLPLDARLAAILLQVGVFGTDYPRFSGKEPFPDLSALRDHISRYYPSDIKMAFVRSRTSLDGQSSVAWIPLHSMLDVRKELVDASLFIPRADYRGLVLSGERPSSRFRAG
jgi:uncharacterized protein YabN with tetrapyrrole methylase and pyrophosphatase domain